MASAQTSKELISPIQFAAMVAPDKPPQYAYQLLKQGLPHQNVYTTSKKTQETKQKPMIDPEVAIPWYEDFILMKPERKRSSSTNEDGSTNSGDPNAKTGTNKTSRVGKAYKAIVRDGQLLTYQRVEGLCTVAQVRAADDTLVYVSTVHGDEVQRDMDKKYTYPFLPDTLKEKILSRKIILDNPRQVIQYAINSLVALPVQASDTELAHALKELLHKYPNTYVKVTTNDDTTTTTPGTDEADRLEQELEETPIAATVEDDGDDEDE